MNNALTRDNVLFLGLDSSTQGLKATVIDPEFNIVSEDAINFDGDLAEFKTEGGAHHHPDGLTVTAPPMMWVKAIDMLLEKLKRSGAPLGRITAISGSGQQHGSVWLKADSRKRLQSLQSGKSLAEQMAGAFSVEESPIWMDSSTGKQCRELEEALGGPQAVADLTGSRAYERFTGNQIAKIFQLDPDRYEATDRIMLVSSFVASLLAGDYVAIDAADGSGMNLMDIRSKQWVPAALECAAPGLAAKLGEIVPSHSLAGRLHGYYVDKYGFSSDCAVIVFSGDNPNSLAGLRLQNTGDIAVSLGTSDTVFGSLAEPAPSADEGHIFANPVDPDAYMALFCYKNGSLTREYVRDEFAGGSWDEFNRLLEDTPVGNNGNIGFYIREPEITPPVMKTGITRYDSGGRKVKRFPGHQDIRAVLEGQFLSMRLHAANAGIRPASILATGGASKNMAILKVMADVFGKPIRVAQQSDSASLGAAYRAMHGWTCSVSGRFVPFAEVLSSAPAFKTALQPDVEAQAVYSSMLDRYRQLEKDVVKTQKI